MNLPVHLALIMDGNGRWAKKNGKNRVFGHKKGVDIAKNIIMHCLNREISWLSLFAFSTENWQRPASEVLFLMQMMFKALNESWQELNQKNIRVYFVGNLTSLPKKLQKLIHKIETATVANFKMNLVFAINYSGKWAILKTIEKIIQSNPKDITEQTFNLARVLPEMPEVDLLIRTSGEMRLSNFHLWEIAYSELFFSKTLWPDFTTAELDQILQDFQQRNRRFGAITE